MEESIYLAAQTVGLPTAVYKLISSDCGAHRMRSTANKKRASYYSRVVNWLTVVRAQFNINITINRNRSVSRDSRLVRFFYVGFSTEFFVVCCLPIYIILLDLSDVRVYINMLP